MQITIRGKRFNLRWVNRLRKDRRGDCDGPHVKSKAIRVLRGLEPQRELDTIVHELLHAGLWDLDDEVVERLGTDIAKTLWKLGYRKQTKEV